MTTYRRFCCSDLLRLGQINIPASEFIRTMENYLTFLALWPDNCLVAEAPGGRITGYALGCAAGFGVERTGYASVVAVRNKDQKAVATKLSKLVEDSCNYIYNCYQMIRLVVNKTAATDECMELASDM